MRRDNIVLIGMAGAGKSTLGVLLAKTLGMDFIDTDLLIQQQTGLLLQQLLDREGMDAFLQTEERIVCALETAGSVIATGGSVVYSARAMEHLAQNGCIVFLDVPYAQLEKRLTNITTRGVVMKKGYTLRDLYQERQTLYRQYAQVTVDCGTQDVEACVRELVTRLEQ